MRAQVKFLHRAKAKMETHRPGRRKIFPISA